MATIRKRIGKLRTTYRAEVHVNGRRESATFDTQSEAHRWAEETEHLLRTGQPLPDELPDHDRLFADAAREYLGTLERKKRLSTASKHMYQHAAKRLLRGFGEKTLKTLTRADVTRYRDQRLEVVGPASVRHDFVFLRGLYRYARLEWGVDMACPVDDVAAPPPPRHREPLLTVGEIERLLDWCCVSESENLYTYILLMLHTAMRPSEAAGLTWDRVQLTDGVIVLLNTKTGKPRRVPLTATAKKMLSQLKRQEDSGGRPVFLPPTRKADSNPSAYFRRAFSTACRNAGLSGITLYSLRHIAASYLVMLGVDLRTVAEILGHSDISMTMRYTHLLDSHKLRAIAALDTIGR